MGQIHWSFFFLQLIPEAALTILFGYAFQRRKIDSKFPVASMILAVMAYIINFILPIRKETRSILIFVMGALILIGYNKIDVLKAVFSCFTLMAIFVIAEILEIWTLLYVLKVDQSFFKEVLTVYTIERWIYGLPNFIFKILTVVGVYFFMTRGYQKNHAVK